MAQRAGFDQNNDKTLIGLSNAGDRAIVEAWFDPVTHRLLTSGGGGGGIVTESYDYISVSYPLSNTEIYTYKTGGSGGTTVATVIVVYTDGTKENLSSVTKS